MGVAAGGCLARRVVVPFVLGGEGRGWRPRTTTARPVSAASRGLHKVDRSGPQEPRQVYHATRMRSILAQGERTRGR